MICRMERRLGIELLLRSAEMSACGDRAYSSFLPALQGKPDQRKITAVARRLSRAWVHSCANRNQDSWSSGLNVVSALSEAFFCFSGKALCVCLGHGQLDNEMSKPKLETRDGRTSAPHLDASLGKRTGSSYPRVQGAGAGRVADRCRLILGAAGSKAGHVCRHRHAAGTACRQTVR